jgi:DNA-binding NarL/FixJ family response regulator
VLILTAYADDDYVSAAIGAGASGYLLKTAPGHELVSAIRAMHEGATVFDAAITNKLRLRQNSAAFAPPLPTELTEREREVLRLVYDGLANKAIALRLGISRRTVEGHLHRIFDKVDVGSRTGLLKYALDHHMLSADSGL